MCLDDSHEVAAAPRLRAPVVIVEIEPGIKTSGIRVEYYDESQSNAALLLMVQEALKYAKPVHQIIHIEPRFPSDDPLGQAGVWSARWA